MASLPSRPSYEQLRKQAKDLHRACARHDTAAAQHLHDTHPDDTAAAAEPADAKLADAQLVIAREHGFSSWPQLQRSLADLEVVANEVVVLQAQFAQANADARQVLLEGVHDRARFVDYRDGDTSLSEVDARLVIANGRGYALWTKYESFLHLDPNVKDVVDACLVGDRDRLRALLDKHPEAANPSWVADYQPQESAERPEIPNDSIPLFTVSDGVFSGSNRLGNEGDLARDLLQAGADPNLIGQPLEGAMSYNCPRVVEALIEGGVDVDAPAPGVMMAYGMLFGFTECCELLANAGAQIDLRFAAGLGQLDRMAEFVTETGLTSDPGLADPYVRYSVEQGGPSVRAERTDDVVLGQALLYACLHGRFDAADWLLQRGADVNAVVRGTDVDATVLHRLVSGHFGATATVEQVEAARRPMIEWLLERGADPSIVNAVHDPTVVQWARHNGREQTASWLEKSSSDGPYHERGSYMPVDNQRGSVESAISTIDSIVETSDADALDRFLSDDPTWRSRQAKWKGSRRETDLLTHVASLGVTDLVDVLLAHEVQSQVNIPSVFYSCLQSGQLAIADRLFEHCAVEIHHLQEHLYQLTEDLNVEGVRWLLQQGANPDYRRAGIRWTPLHNALHTYPALLKERQEICRLLVEAGADHDSNAVYDLITGRSESLVTRIAADPTIVHTAFDLRGGRDIEIERRGDYGGAPVSNTSLLHHCAEYGWVDEARLLLAKGADPNQRAEPAEDGFDTHTPIFNTLTTNANASWDVLQLLVEAGADVNAVADICIGSHEMRGVTPLGYIEGFPNKYWKDVGNRSWKQVGTLDTAPHPAVIDLLHRHGAK
jgi:ankyrin repeat protein